MLSETDKAFYDGNGYLLVEEVLSQSQLDEARRVTYALIEASRDVDRTNEVYDLDIGHGPEMPRLTRIKLPHKQDRIFRDLLTGSRITTVLTGLLGPDTMLQTSKLNTKAPGGGAAVEWHQDWAFYPHSNDAMLALGVMLEDVTVENGALMVIPQSHKGPVLNHFNNGLFCGAVDPSDPGFDMSRAVTLTGKAGSMTVHHARLLHGSAPNNSERNRLILFYECHAADAWPLLGASSYIHELGQRRLWDDLQERLITGKLCLTPRLEAVPVTMPLPPAPNAGSIFELQRSGGAKSAFG